MKPNSDFVLPDGKAIDAEEYLFAECPLCGKENHFYWNIKKNVGNCKKCGDSVFGRRNLERLIKEGNWELRTTTPSAQTGYVSKLIHNIRYGYRTSAWDYDETRWYLKGVRRLDQQTVDQIPIQYISEVKAMIAPIDGLSPELPEEIIFRRLQGWPNKWVGLPGVRTGPYAFGVRHLPKKCKRLLFCEGLFDIASPGLLGYAVACLGTSVGNIWGAWARKIGLEEAWLWFDPDKAGDSGLKKLHKILSVRGIDVKLVNCPMDPKDVGKDKRIIQDLKEHLHG